MRRPQGSEQPIPDMKTCTDTSAIDYLIIAAEVAVFVVLLALLINGISKLAQKGVRLVLDSIRCIARRGLRLGNDQGLHGE